MAEVTGVGRFSAATTAAVLRALSDLGAGTASQVAPVVHLKSGTVQMVLRAAERDGLVEVVPRTRSSKAARALVYRAVTPHRAPTVDQV